MQCMVLRKWEVKEVNAVHSTAREWEVEELKEVKELGEVAEVNAVHGAAREWEVKDVKAAVMAIGAARRCVGAGAGVKGGAGRPGRGAVEREPWRRPQTVCHN